MPSGTPNIQCNSIATDASGSLYLTGTYKGIVDFDPGSSTYTLASSANKNIFISELNSTGNFVSASQLVGGFMGNGYSGPSITTDAINNIYLTGFFWNNCDFDPTPNTFSLTSNGLGDTFILKLGQGTTSVNQNVKNSNTINVFPNPVKDLLNISFNYAANKVNIKLLNTLGQIVFEKENISGSNYQLETAGFLSGIYIAEITTGENCYRTKVIKD